MEFGKRSVHDVIAAEGVDGDGGDGGDGGGAAAGARRQCGMRMRWKGENDIRKLTTRGRHDASFAALGA